MIRAVGEKVQGKASGKAPLKTESWWWNEEVQMNVREKREAKKIWEMSRLEQGKHNNKHANKRAKNAVARAKAIALDEMYKKEKGGERKALIAKAREKQPKTTPRLDRSKMVLNEEEKIRDRWKSYFESLLNEENPKVVFEDRASNFGVTCDISRLEVKEALRIMKSGKVTRPDNIPAEVWKFLDEGIDMWDLMSKIYEEEQIPNEWRDSVIIPIYKEKRIVAITG